MCGVISDWFFTIKEIPLCTPCLDKSEWPTLQPSVSLWVISLSQWNLTHSITIPVNTNVICCGKTLLVAQYLTTQLTTAVQYNLIYVLKELLNPTPAYLYDTSRYFNVRLKADISQLNLLHGAKNWKVGKKVKTDVLRSISKQSRESLESVLKNISSLQLQKILKVAEWIIDGGMMQCSCIP